jgi:hypothetical protein
VGFLAILSVGIASIRVAVIVGANVYITYGKETGITNATWNFCEVKNVIGSEGQTYS